MRRIIIVRNILFALGAFTVGSLALAVLAPKLASDLMLAGKNWSLGLSLREVQTESGPVAYLDGGQGETVVFVHGIYARKEHWVDVAAKVRKGHRVVLLDLPGFGDNEVLGAGAYEYDSQLANLTTVLDALKIQRAHFVANSMGAQIVGMLAVSDPERVESIAFVGGPAGVPSPKPSDMDRILEAGRSPLIVGSEEDYTNRMPWLFPNTPFIPPPISKSWAREEAGRGEANQRIWDEVKGTETVPLSQLATSIHQPTLILWCTEDRVFDVSGADSLHQTLKDSRLYIMEDCGHLPMLDAPEETAKLLSAFLGSVER